MHRPVSARVPGITDGASPTDRRTRKRELRRDDAYRAAISLFIERGFENTTMDDIAERADLARATVFNHFARKTAFLDEWAARRRRVALHAAYSTNLVDHPMREVLERYMTELARINEETRTETVSLMGAAVRNTNVLSKPALGDELVPLLRRASVREELTPSVEPELVALLLATGYFAILTEWIDADPPSFDLRERLHAMVHLMLHGMSLTPDA